MPSDLTRPATGDLRQHYKAVVMQQGRVILDRDFNALQDIVNGRIAADALDEIGPCGTPDDGLAVSLPPAGHSVSASVSFSGPHPWDFLVKPGTIYVGGQRVVFDTPPAQQPPLSYFHQPDWIYPPDPFAQASASFSFPRHEFVFLHAFEQEVGAVEDPDLLDVALGGPDTTQRVRLMRRIVRLGVTGTDCSTALAEAVTDWGRHGYLFDPATMRLLPQAALQVGFTSALSTSNPCDPVAQGGYLGAENQVIRVMIAGPGGGSGTSLLWGYDNASFLYRVTVAPDGMTLQLAQPPVDAFHNPRTGQYVEVLRTAAVLGTEPDQTDPTGQRTIVRCVAKATGHVAQVAKYNNGDNTLVLAAQLPGKYTSDPNPLFLRVWVGWQSFTPSASVPIVLTDPTGQTAPGIQVTITQPATAAKGAALPGGAFWLFAVRPATPQAVYPERFLDGPQPPDGPRQWVCPLAVIDWAGRDSVSFSAPSAVIHDCRCSFDNLVTLTNRRLGGCCTVTARPSDAPKLQGLIDTAVGKYRAVTVCFAPGTYLFPQPLRLGARHAGLVLESCSGAATLQADPAADPTRFLDGLIVLTGADHVSLRNLRLNLPAVPLMSALGPSPGNTPLGRVIAQYTNPQSMIGLRLVVSRGTRVEGCRFGYSPQAQASTFGMGIFAQSDCRGTVVRGCRFESDTPSTVTPPPSTTTTAPGTTTTVAIANPVTVVPVHSAPPVAIAVANASSLTERVRLQSAATIAQAAVTPAGFVALVGCVAISSISPSGIRELVIQAFLDGGVVADNEFDNLTLAAFLDGEIGTFRVRGNRATACFGGFWLAASNYTPPTDPKDPNYRTQWNNHLDAATSFVEVSAIIWASLFPFPAGNGTGQTTNGPSGPGPLSLSVTDNRLEAILASSAVPGAALLLLLSRSTVEGSDTSASLVLSSNELRGRSVQVPVALVATNGSTSLSVSGPTAVTGNLVINSGFVRNPSLMLYPGGGFSNAVGVAVTGNVLVGVNTLGGLTAADLTHWGPLNSIII
jgi:hypothetical protein